jgi:hypothetical protein
MTTEENESMEQSRRRIVKARWAILRNALLNRDGDGSSSTTINLSSQSSEQTKQHSIHRFKGYNLLNGRPVVDSQLLSPIESSLCIYQWNSYQSLGENINRLEIAILALSACFSKGTCIRVIISSSEVKVNNNSASWLTSLQKRCQPSVRILNINEEKEATKEQKAEDSLSSTNNDIITSTSTTTTTTTTLLVQETSTSTNYKTLMYDLHSNDADKTNNNNNENCDEPSSLINTQQEGHLPSPCFRFIWTREPKEKRLTLDDLVSHRKNKGVDNTGNICVWDSEKTLAYLLYNHYDDFFTVTTTTGAVICNNNYDNLNTIVCSCHDDNDNDDHDDDDIGDTEYEYNKDENVDTSLDNDDDHRHSEVRIMELGTGMAGLSAVALGFRIEIRRQQQQQQYSQPDNEYGDDEETNKDNHENKKTKKSVQIMLTDGNPEGVKNNTINQYLTRLNSNHNLNIKCDILLWTTDCSSNDGNGDDGDQDVILVSDCVHFQNFHAALTITTFRCLRVGGTAIFCQPTRGPSLDNFLKLLSTATEQPEQQKISVSSPMSQSNNINTNNSTTRKKKKNSPLMRISWLSHPIIEQKHQEARSKHNAIYDENLHKPKILMITKLRDMIEEDRLRFIAYQQRYSPDKPTVVHAVEG